MTVDEFYEKYVNFDVDIIFLDCEGYDHDIIKKLLNIQEPNLIYFESWNTKNLNSQLNENVFTTRDEIIDILTSKGYFINFEPTEENIIAYKND